MCAYESNPRTANMVTEIMQYKQPETIFSQSVLPQAVLLYCSRYVAG